MPQKTFSVKAVSAWPPWCHATHLLHCNQGLPESGWIDYGRITPLNGVNWYFVQSCNFSRNSNKWAASLARKIAGFSDAVSDRK